MPTVKNFHTSVNSKPPCFSDTAQLPSENEDNTELQIEIIGFIMPDDLPSPEVSFQSQGYSYSLLLFGIDQIQEGKSKA